MSSIVIKGAAEHNLKNIDLTLPRDRLIAVTGLSGSGKSSLAFDTIFAEGQRRYVESLSAYARQFLQQMQKPQVEFIEGLSPAIAIEQRKASSNPRSTVGTVTEIYDYLRLLFARVGVPHCPRCGKVISRQTVQEIVDAVSELPERSRVQILSPLVRGRKGEHRAVLEGVARQGFVRVIVDGEARTLEEEIVLDKNRRHDIYLVVDRLIIKPGMGKDRLTDSVETALKLGGGLLAVRRGDSDEHDLVFNERFSCPECQLSFEELSPRMFSFNSPYGACTVCSGLGTKMEVDPNLVVPDRAKSIAEGAIEPWSVPITTRRQRWKRSAQSWYMSQLEAVAKEYGFDFETPFRELTPLQQKVVLYGTGANRVDVEWSNTRGYGRYAKQFEGVINNLERRYRDTESDYVREEIFSKYITLKPCPSCRGLRLKPESLAVKIGGRSIMDICSLSIADARAFFERLALGRREAAIAREVLKEIGERIGFLENVGLSYLTLARASGSLSGGEAQRIRLATQIGSALVGVLYVLDEPSIGLHQRDNRRLLATLGKLRDLGNTVLLVEHDEAAIRAADFIVDLGPGAGEKGGEVVAA
ncbi:MAG TPA: excinuclease ABC subunit UvrA, partial [bacterium]|nr:excinuclease ABC subunit UvrA [bacterium]